MVDLRIRIATVASDSEAHRTIKVWRALWVRTAGMGICEKDRDPSLQFSNSAPGPRLRTPAKGAQGKRIRAGLAGLDIVTNSYVPSTHRSSCSTAPDPDWEGRFTLLVLRQIQPAADSWA